MVSFFFLFDIWCLCERVTVKDIDFSWSDCYLIHWMIFRHYYVNRNMKDVCICFFLENNWIKKETNSEDKIVLWNFYPLLGITNIDFVIFTKIQKLFDLWCLFFVFFYLAIDSCVCFNFFDGLKWYKFAFDMARNCLNQGNDPHFKQHLFQGSNILPARLWCWIIFKL